MTAQPKKEISNALKQMAEQAWRQRAGGQMIAGKQTCFGDVAAQQHV
jgi:hypothetical protein